MWKNLRGAPLGAWWWISLCGLCAACGSSTDSGGSALFGQEPHCPNGMDALKMEGSVGDAAIDDTRSTNLNAGYENIGTPKFSSPFSSLGQLDADQVALTITWAQSLFDGQVGAITGGSLTIPGSPSSARATYCLSAGEVGFVSGGSEDGAFKFAVTQVHPGADCAGPAMAVDLRGCYQ